MLLHKVPCLALLLILLPAVSCENVTRSGIGSDAMLTESAKLLDGFSESYESHAPLPFPGDSVALMSQESMAMLSARRRRKASRRRRRTSTIRRRTTRRRSSRRRKTRRRRRRSPTTTTQQPTTAPPLQTTRKPTGPSPHNPDSVDVPDNVEYMSVGGCADSRGKLFGGVVAAGTNPKTFTMYKPRAAEKYMTLQGCVDILSHLGKISRNGKMGIAGVRGLRYGACHTYAGERHCVCYILGEGAEAARQFPINGQLGSEWPQQCCNPIQNGCGQCSFTINGPNGGGRGPITSGGGGFAGVCYRLKNSF